ncbi:Glutaredoxin-C4 [Auxenochlorella protothecoides]|uniref:Glutaredoxin-C4 n=2 Tax=Auxenochlorella protothecoides TaxID=3075 RepID=A0A087SKE7_AUXPR|nr:Glutaredoxin-C4 [Auxenochlorella protothecoides]KFM26201.1 Glutaredoxin-C4 [Auxenochlorella protothecoides]RMZ56657.1 hypothetical protein APUTEX25_002746 [Auxenochlorella protothecoides]|eukprot:RMZ56657.1 hypothetical protein APUTEX25_002746 [Auxenochlorella protothecoides]
MRILYVTILAAVSVYLFVSLRSLGSTPTPPKMATPAEFVKQTISETRVVVFSKTFCPYCKKAKAALASVGLKGDALKVIELDTREDGNAIQDALLELTGGRSVPRVFIDGDFFGGGDDTDAAAKSGKLAELLRSKGIL